MIAYVLETSGLVAGHEAGWLRVLLEVLDELGVEVCLVSPELEGWLGELPDKAIKHASIPRYKDVGLFNWRSHVKTLPSSLVFHRYLRRLASLEILKPELQKHLIFNNWDVFHSQIPYVNKMLLSRIKFPWSAFWFRPNPSRIGSDIFTKNLSALFYLTEQDREWMDSVTNGRAVWLPDFAANTVVSPRSELAEKLAEAADGRPVVTLAGVLGRRKGVIRFLRLADEARKAGKNMVFALVGDFRCGQFSRAEADLVKTIEQSPPSNMFLHLRPVQEESEFNAVLSSSSVLYLLYENYRYSSNFLAKAAAFRVPVLVPDQGALCSRTRDYSLGGVIGEKESDVEVLERLEVLSESGPLSEDSCSRYLALHSRHRFKSILKKSFEELF